MDGGLRSSRVEDVVLETIEIDTSLGPIGILCGPHLRLQTNASNASGERFARSLRFDPSRSVFQNAGDLQHLN